MCNYLTDCELLAVTLCLCLLSTYLVLLGRRFSTSGIHQTNSEVQQASQLSLCTGIFLQIIWLQNWLNEKIAEPGGQILLRLNFSLTWYSRYSSASSQDCVTWGRRVCYHRYSPVVSGSVQLVQPVQTQLYIFPVLPPPLHPEFSAGCCFLLPAFIISVRNLYFLSI